METVTISPLNPSTDFIHARLQAVGKARQTLSRPVIIAWKDDNIDRYGPRIPDGTGDRWHEYGVSQGGRLELHVGDTFHFIFSEAGDFAEPGRRLSNLCAEDGTTFLCLNEARTDEDRRRSVAGCGDDAGGG